MNRFAWFVAGALAEAAFQAVVVVAVVVAGERYQRRLAAA